MIKPRPDITETEAKLLEASLFHLGYIKSTPGKWVLTMKGQQVFHLMKEYQKIREPRILIKRWIVV